MQEVQSWAYKYSRIPCKVIVGNNSKSAYDTREIYHQERIGVDVTLTVWCEGYPAPYLAVTAASTSSPAPRLIQGDSSTMGNTTWTLQKFGDGVSKYNFSLIIMYEACYTIPCSKLHSMSHMLS